MDSTLMKFYFFSPPHERYHPYGNRTPGTVRFIRLIAPVIGSSAGRVPGRIFKDNQRQDHITPIRPAAVALPRDGGHDENKENAIRR
jgi:hypothetical protein